MNLSNNPLPKPRHQRLNRYLDETMSKLLPMARAISGLYPLSIAANLYGMHTAATKLGNANSERLRADAIKEVSQTFHYLTNVVVTAELAVIKAYELCNQAIDSNKYCKNRERAISLTKFVYALSDTIVNAKWFFLLQKFGDSRNIANANLNEVYLAQQSLALQIDRLEKLSIYLNSQMIRKIWPRRGSDGGLDDPTLWDY